VSINSEEVQLSEAVRREREEDWSRNIETSNTVVQGIGRQLWKWGSRSKGRPWPVRPRPKLRPWQRAERAIDRALAPKKLKLVRPERDR